LGWGPASPEEDDEEVLPAPEDIPDEELELLAPPLLEVEEELPPVLLVQACVPTRTTRKMGSVLKDMAVSPTQRRNIAIDAVPLRGWGEAHV